MKIVSRKCELNLNKTIQYEISQSKFMLNIQIKHVIAMNRQQIALIRSSSILIHNTITHIKTIALPYQIEHVLYIPKTNLFYAYAIIQKKIISISNEENPVIKDLYCFDDNATNILFEWSPWMFCLHQSQYLILVRKLYGESLVVVFKASIEFQKLWQFTCNESSLSKLDENNYLVNSQQYNNKYILKFSIYNIIQQQKTLFKIDNIQPNICKSIKLFQKNTQKLHKDINRIWLKVIVGVNYKITGGGILLINILQGSNNNYQVLARISLGISEIDTVLDVDEGSRTIKMLLFRYDEQSKQSQYFFGNYVLNNIENQITQTDTAIIDQITHTYTYNPILHQLIAFNNNYTKKRVDSYQNMKHTITINAFRVINKKMAFIHLMQSSFKSLSENMMQVVVNLL